MSFFNSLFGNNNDSSEPQPDVKFGRYTDSYKTKIQYDAWDKALEEFEEEKYLECYRSFFLYLRDERENNVSFTETTQMFAKLTWVVLPIIRVRLNWIS